MTNLTSIWRGRGGEGEILKIILLRSCHVVFVNFCVKDEPEDGKHNKPPI